MEEDRQHFQHIRLYYFEKGKNANETQKNLVQCPGKVLWLIERVRSGLWSFMLEISRWTMLHSQSGRPFAVDSDQIETLIENNQHSTTRERADILKTSNSMKLFSENEKCVFYFMEKTKQTFWPAPCIVTSSWGWATCHRDYCPHTATPVDACSALLALGTGRGLACQRRRGLHGS